MTWYFQVDFYGGGGCCSTMEAPMYTVALARLKRRFPLHERILLRPFNR